MQPAPPTQTPYPYQPPAPGPGMQYTMVHPDAKQAETYGLVWGLVSLIGGFLLWIPWFLGFVAISYGNKAKRGGANGTPGVVMGWIAVALGFASILVFLVLFGIVAAAFGAA